MRGRCERKVSMAILRALVMAWGAGLSLKAWWKRELMVTAQASTLELISWGESLMNEPSSQDSDSMVKEAAMGQSLV